jgi:hypothetical protein
MHATTPMVQDRARLTATPAQVRALPPLSLVPTKIDTQRGRTYTEIAQQPLARLKLWLGYTVDYRDVCSLPMTDAQRESVVRATRRWLHGVEDGHDDLMGLIEHGLDEDTARWPT